MSARVFGWRRERLVNPASPCCAFGRPPAGRHTLFPSTSYPQTPPLPLSPNRNVLNYVMSASPISLAGFALPSAAAAIPYTLLFCYMGSASNDLMAALQGGGDMHVSMTWLIVSPLLLLASGAGVVLLMKRIMASTTQAALVAAEFELPVTVANALTSSCMGHHALVDQDDGEDTAHARGSCIELGERERLSLDVRHEPCSPMLGPVTHIISSAPRRPRVSSPA